MPKRNQAALDFLLTRRSVPAKMLTAPVPDRAEVDMLLTAAARTPDHGAIVPYRFLVVERPAMARLIDEIKKAGARQGRPPEQIAKPLPHYESSHLAVVVVSKPDPTASVPVSEQVLTAGAVCLALTNAALAAGWGANWLSGWFSHDPIFCRDMFALTKDETIAGIVHIGTPRARPSDRPRPDVAAITRWISE